MSRNIAFLNKSIFEIGIRRRALATLALAVVASSIVEAKAESLVDGLKRQIANLPENEHLITLKIAENEAVSLFRNLLNLPEGQSMALNSRMRVGVIIFGSISLVLLKDQPDISNLYAQRTELLADVIRGKETLSSILPREMSLQREINLTMELKHLAIVLTNPLQEAGRASVVRNGATLGRDMFASALRQVREQPAR